MRAVAGQWMRRRSSPSRYSRIVTSSSPCRAMRWACSPSEPTPALGLAVRRERVHGRQHDEVGGALEHGVAVGQAERVLHLDPEGAEVVASAQVGAHGVVDGAHAARRDPADDEARPVAEDVVEALLGEEDRRRGGRDVLEGERDVGVLSDADPLGVGVPLDAHPGLAGAHEHGGDEGERDEEHPEAGEVAEAEDDTGEHEDGARAHEGPAPRRQDAAQRAHGRVPRSAGCGRHRHLAQQVGDHLGGGAAGELGLARRHEAVREDRPGQHLHVVGITWSRPSSAAYARDARSRCSAARGDAPSRSAVVARERVTRSTMYWRMAGLAWTWLTACTTRLIVSASVTGVRASSGRAGAVGLEQVELGARVRGSPSRCGP